MGTWANCSPVFGLIPKFELMQNPFIEYIFLILIILALVMIARKLNVAYPIVLVIGGLILGFTTTLSHLTIDPELVFFIFLPPLLYEAAWQISWKEFWRWRRIITSFAFPIVILTSCVIAFVSSTLIPGFTLALGFLLGGIISPPDAISATTIMRQVNVPKTYVSIAEGESLLNDASSLVVFRFALASVITGQFHFQEAAVDFFVVIIMGTLVGLLIALIFYSIHRWLPTTPSIEIVMTLVTPYCMYSAAEYFHFSGVLAVVSGGLFLSIRRNSMLNYQSRIQGFNVWSILGFVLNGIVFMLIGLQLPSIVQQFGEVSLRAAIWYGIIISLVLIATRFACTFGAAAFTRFISRWITVADNRPEWKAPLILGWSGMRGVVSLAAALSIPVLLPGGEAFPHRNLILFITFIVILITLVVQGLTLPWLVRKIKPTDRFTVIPEKEQEVIIQKKMAMVSLKYLEEKYTDHRKSNEHLDNLFSRLSLELRFFETEMDAVSHGNDNNLKSFQLIYLELLDQQRSVLDKINHKQEYDEEIIRKYLTLIDIEEFKLREKLII